MWCLEEALLAQFQVDEGGNHGAVGPLRDVRIRLQLRRNRADAGDDLLHPLGIPYVRAHRFELAGGPNPDLAFGDPGDNFVIDPVDLGSYVVQRVLPGGASGCLLFGHE